jgi:hypothetical protein
MKVYIAVLILLLGGLINHGAANAQIFHPTCAETWIKAHKPKSTATADGQACILGGKPTSQPSSQAYVMSLLVKHITPATAFVSHPPTDIATFCPKYAGLDGAAKAAMWRNLFLALVPWESDFNNASLMMDDDQYSIGLYQMSVTDGGCGLKRESDLVDPDRNTACAVAKMSKLASPGASKLKGAGVIGGDAARIGVGAAMYWHTLRVQGVPRGAQHASRAAIIKASVATPGCS